MRRLLPSAVVAALAGCFSGEGSGQLAFKAFPVADFDAVTLASEGSVTITQGDFAVFASAEDNVLPSLRAIRTSGDGGAGNVLMLRRDVDVIDGVRAELPIEFHVSMPVLAEARVSGRGAMAIRGVAVHSPLRLGAKGSSVVDIVGLAADQVAVDASGAAAVTVADLRARHLECAISGSAHVSIAGSARELALGVRGSGVFRSARLRIVAAEVRVHGAGQAFVWVEEGLVAEVGGNGRLAYRGQPTVRQTLQRDGRIAPLADLGPHDG